MEINFTKDEKGNEVATISKAEFDKAIAEAKNSGAVEGKKTAMAGIESKYDISIEEIKQMRKELKAMNEEKAKNTVKQVYIANGGKAEYFDDFYASNNLANSQNIEEDMAKVKETKKIYFNIPEVKTTTFPQGAGVNTDTSGSEILNDGKGKSLSEMLYK